VGFSRVSSTSSLLARKKGPSRAATRDAVKDTAASPLLAFLEELPLVLRTEVLPRLDVVDTYLLGQVSRATRAAVKDSGFSFSLLGGFLR
jgi:hypothetical protein